MAIFEIITHSWSCFNYFKGQISAVWKPW